MLWMQLHDAMSIVFAGYRIPHPLETKLKVRVQTNGTKSPEEAMRHALEDLNAEFNTILNQFNDECDPEKFWFNHLPTDLYAPKHGWTSETDVEASNTARATNAVASPDLALRPVQTYYVTLIGPACTPPPLYGQTERDLRQARTGTKRPTAQKVTRKERKGQDSAEATARLPDPAERRTFPQAQTDRTDRH
eukprot:gene18270-24723_t